MRILHPVKILRYNDIGEAFKKALEMLHPWAVLETPTVKCCLLRDESEGIQEWRMHAQSASGVLWNYLNIEQI